MMALIMECHVLLAMKLGIESVLDLAAAISVRCEKRPQKAAHLAPTLRPRYKKTPPKHPSNSRQVYQSTRYINVDA